MNKLWNMLKVKHIIAVYITKVYKSVHIKSSFSKPKAIKNVSNLLPI